MKNLYNNILYIMDSNNWYPPLLKTIQNIIYVTFTFIEWCFNTIWILPNIRKLRAKVRNLIKNSEQKITFYFHELSQITLNSDNAKGLFWEDKESLYVRTFQERNCYIQKSVNILKDIKLTPYVKNAESLFYKKQYQELLEYQDLIVSFIQQGEINNPTLKKSYIYWFDHYIKKTKPLLNTDLQNPWGGYTHWWTWHQDNIVKNIYQYHSIFKYDYYKNITGAGGYHQWYRYKVWGKLWKGRIAFKWPSYKWRFRAKRIMPGRISNRIFAKYLHEFIQIGSWKYLDLAYSINREALEDFAVRRRDKIVYAHQTYKVEGIKYSLAKKRTYRIKMQDKFLSIITGLSTENREMYTWKRIRFGWPYKRFNKKRFFGKNDILYLVPKNKYNKLSHYRGFNTTENKIPIVHTLSLDRDVNLKFYYNSSIKHMLPHLQIYKNINLKKRMATWNLQTKIFKFWLNFTDMSVLNLAESFRIKNMKANIIQNTHKMYLKINGTSTSIPQKKLIIAKKIFIKDYSQNVFWGNWNRSIIFDSLFNSKKQYNIGILNKKIIILNEGTTSMKEYIIKYISNPLSINNRVYQQLLYIIQNIPLYITNLLSTYINVFIFFFNLEVLIVYRNYIKWFNNLVLWDIYIFILEDFKKSLYYKNIFQHIANYINFSNIFTVEIIKDIIKNLMKFLIISFIISFYTLICILLLILIKVLFPVFNNTGNNLKKKKNFILDQLLQKKWPWAISHYTIINNTSKIVDYLKYTTEPNKKNKFTYKGYQKLILLKSKEWCHFLEKKKSFLDKIKDIEKTNFLQNINTTLPVWDSKEEMQYQTSLIKEITAYKNELVFVDHKSRGFYNNLFTNHLSIIKYIKKSDKIKKLKIKNKNKKDINSKYGFVLQTAFYLYLLNENLWEKWEIHKDNFIYEYNVLGELSLAREQDSIENIEGMRAFRNMEKNVDQLYIESLKPKKSGFLNYLIDTYNEKQRLKLKGRNPFIDLERMTSTDIVYTLSEKTTVSKETTKLNKSLKIYNIPDKYNLNEIIKTNANIVYNRFLFEQNLDKFRSNRRYDGVSFEILKNFMEVFTKKTKIKKFFKNLKNWVIFVFIEKKYNMEHSYNTPQGITPIIENKKIKYKYIKKINKINKLKLIFNYLIGTFKLWNWTALKRRWAHFNNYGVEIQIDYKGIFKYDPEKKLSTRWIRNASKLPKALFLKNIKNSTKEIESTIYNIENMGFGSEEYYKEEFNLIDPKLLKKKKGLLKVLHKHKVQTWTVSKYRNIINSTSKDLKEPKKIELKGALDILEKRKLRYEQYLRSKYAKVILKSKLTLADSEYTTEALGSSEYVNKRMARGYTDYLKDTKVETKVYLEHKFKLKLAQAQEEYKCRMENYNQKRIDISLDNIDDKYYLKIPEYTKELDNISDFFKIEVRRLLELQRLSLIPKQSLEDKITGLEPKIIRIEDNEKLYFRWFPTLIARLGYLFLILVGIFNWLTRNFALYKYNNSDLKNLFNLTKMQLSLYILKMYFEYSFLDINSKIFKNKFYSLINILNFVLLILIPVTLTTGLIYLILIIYKYILLIYFKYIKSQVKYVKNVQMNVQLHLKKKGIGLYIYNLYIIFKLLTVNMQTGENIIQIFSSKIYKFLGIFQRNGYYIINFFKKGYREQGIYYGLKLIFLWIKLRFIYFVYKSIDLLKHKKSKIKQITYLKIKNILYKSWLKKEFLIKKLDFIYIYIYTGNIIENIIYYSIKHILFTIYTILITFNQKLNKKKFLKTFNLNIFIISKYLLNLQEDAFKIKESIDKFTLFKLCLFLFIDVIIKLIFFPFSILWYYIKLRVIWVKEHGLRAKLQNSFFMKHYAAILTWSSIKNYLYNISKLNYLSSWIANKFYFTDIWVENYLEYRAKQYNPYESAKIQRLHDYAQFKALRKKYAKNISSYIRNIESFYNRMGTNKLTKNWSFLKRYRYKKKLKKYQVYLLNRQERLNLKRDIFFSRIKDYYWKIKIIYVIKGLINWFGYLWFKKIYFKSISIPQINENIKLKEGPDEFYIGIYLYEIPPQLWLLVIIQEIYYKYFIMYMFSPRGPIFKDQLPSNFKQLRYYKWLLRYQGTFPEWVWFELSTYKDLDAGITTFDSAVRLKPYDPFLRYIFFVAERYVGHEDFSEKLSWADFSLAWNYTYKGPDKWLYKDSTKAYKKNYFAFDEDIRKISYFNATDAGYHRMFNEFNDELVEKGVPKYVNYMNTRYEFKLRNKEELYSYFSSKNNTKELSNSFLKRLFMYQAGVISAPIPNILTTQMEKNYWESEKLRIFDDALIAEAVNYGFDMDEISGYHNIYFKFFEYKGNIESMSDFYRTYIMDSKDAYNLPKYKIDEKEITWLFTTINSLEFLSYDFITHFVEYNFENILPNKKFIIKNINISVIANTIIKDETWKNKAKFYYPVWFRINMNWFDPLQRNLLSSYEYHMPPYEPEKLRFWLKMFNPNLITYNESIKHLDAAREFVQINKSLPYIRLLSDWLECIENNNITLRKLLTYDAKLQYCKKIKFDSALMLQHIKWTWKQWINLDYVRVEQQQVYQHNLHVLNNRFSFITIKAIPIRAKLPICLEMPKSRAKNIKVLRLRSWASDYENTDYFFFGFGFGLGRYLKSSLDWLQYLDKLEKKFKQPITSLLIALLHPDTKDPELLKFREENKVLLTGLIRKMHVFQQLHIKGPMNFIWDLVRYHDVWRDNEDFNFSDMINLKEIEMTRSDKIVADAMDAWDTYAYYRHDPQSYYNFYEPEPWYGYKLWYWLIIIGSFFLEIYVLFFMPGEYIYNVNWIWWPVILILLLLYIMPRIKNREKVKRGKELYLYKHQSAGMVKHKKYRGRLFQREESMDTVEKVIADPNTLEYWDINSALYNKDYKITLYSSGLSATMLIAIMFSRLYADYFHTIRTLWIFYDYYIPSEVEEDVRYEPNKPRDRYTSLTWYFDAWERMVGGGNPYSLWYINVFKKYQKIELKPLDYGPEGKKMLPFVIELWKYKYLSNTPHKVRIRLNFVDLAWLLETNNYINVLSLKMRFYFRRRRPSLTVRKYRRRWKTSEHMENLKLDTYSLKEYGKKQIIERAIFEVQENEDIFRELKEEFNFTIDHCTRRYFVKMKKDTMKLIQYTRLDHIIGKTRKNKLNYIKLKHQLDDQKKGLNHSYSLGKNIKFTNKLVTEISNTLNQTDYFILYLAQRYLFWKKIRQNLLMKRLNNIEINKKFIKTNHLLSEIVDLNKKLYLIKVRNKKLNIDIRRTHTREHLDYMLGFLKRKEMDLLDFTKQEAKNLWIEYNIYEFLEIIVIIVKSFF